MLDVVKEQHTVLFVCLLSCYSFQLPEIGKDTCRTSPGCNRVTLRVGLPDSNMEMTWLALRAIHPSVVEVTFAALSQTATCLGPVLTGSWQLCLYPILFEALTVSHLIF